LVVRTTGSIEGEYAKEGGVFVLNDGEITIRFRHRHHFSILKEVALATLDGKEVTLEDMSCICLNTRHAPGSKRLQGKKSIYNFWRGLGAKHQPGRWIDVVDRDGESVGDPGDAEDQVQVVGDRRRGFLAKIFPTVGSADSTARFRLGIAPKSIGFEEPRRPQSHSIHGQTVVRLNHLVGSHFHGIVERHRDIIGRTNIKDAIKRRLSPGPGGYIVVRGVPGSGKTALLSNLITELSPSVQSITLAHFLFRKGEAASSARVCLQCLLANLITRYSFQTEPIPGKLDLLAALLESVLHQVAARLEAQRLGRPPTEVLIIDALDAADNPTDVVRSLPKNLPENIFILVSSREGPQLDLLRTSIPPDRCVELSLDPDPARPEQLEDACAFLSNRFPTWSRADIRVVVSAASGNFQVLDAFCSACPAAVKPDQALALARKLGRHSADSLTSIYRRFWEQLRSRAISQGPQIWNDVVSLLGLLSVAYESLTEAQLLKLSETGTYGRLDVARSLVQEFLIETAGSDPSGVRAGTKRYTIYHDTFRDFLLDQLSSEVNRIHFRIAKAILDACHAGAKPERMDEYELRHGVAHAALSFESATLRAIISPEYVRHKSAVMESVGPVLSDLSLAIEGCCRASEFADALGFALLKQHLSDRGGSAFPGIQAALNVQMGKFAAGLSLAESLGGADDRVLAFAQTIASKSDVDQALAEHCRTQALSIANNCSPWALEVAAEMIALIDPQAACELARRIPEPKALFDYSTGEENPSSGRCLFRVFQRIANAGGSLAVETAEKLESGREQALAYVAIGIVTFDQNVPAAAALFRKGLALLPEKAHRRYLMTRYFLSRALRQPSEKAAVALLVLDRDFALRPEHLLLWNLVDQHVLAAPGQWIELRNKLKADALKSLVSWRLVELGLLNRSAIGKRVNSDISDLPLASEIAHHALATPRKAVEDARLLRSLAGFGSIFDTMLKRVRKRDHEAACILASQVIQSLSQWPPQSRLLALTWLIESAFELGPAQGAELIAPCLSAIAEWEPRCDCQDADAALWVPISRFVTKSPSSSASRFRMILQVANSEKWKEVAGTKILTYCDLTLCRTLARKPAAFGVLDRATGEACTRRNALLPETQISIMLTAARRLSLGDRRLACKLLAQSSDYAASISNQTIRQECTQDVIINALIVSPAFAKRLFGKCLPAPAEFLSAAKAALYEVRSGQTAAEDFLRCEIESSLPPEDLRHERLRQFFVARRRIALQEDITCPALAIAADFPLPTKQWLEEFVDVIAFVYEHAEHAASTSTPKRRKRDIFSLHEIATAIGEVDWPSFVRLAKHPSVGAYVMKNMSQRQLARVALIHQSNRAPQFQRDLQELLSFVPSMERANGDESLTAYLTLVSAAAGVDPALCLELLAEMPTSDRPFDAYSITQFERRAPWTDTQASRLFELVTTLPDARIDEIVEAGTLGWCAARMANPRFFSELAARRAMGYESGAAVHRLANALSAVAPDLTQPLFERSLSQSLAAGDDETLLAALRTTPNLTGGRIAEILRPRVQRPECDHSAEFLREAAELQAQHCPEDAITTLKFIQPGAQDVEKAILYRSA
jgi:hypothetical protein